MLDSPHLLGALSVVITVIGYAVYLVQMRLTRVLPHPLSWFLWGSTTLVTFCIQTSRAAGPGSWMMAITAMMCLMLFFYSWHKGGRLSHSKDDWIFFTGGLFVLAWYAATVYQGTDPTYAAIVATIADLIAYLPTISKAWSRPYDDSATSFSFNSLKFLPSIVALGPYSTATHLLAVALLIMNALMAVLLLVRRSIVAPPMVHRSRNI